MPRRQKLTACVESAILYLAVKKYIRPGKKVLITINGKEYVAESIKTNRKKLSILAIDHYEDLIWVPIVIENVRGTANEK